MVTCNLSWGDVEEAAYRTAIEIGKWCTPHWPKTTLNIYPVPRGGLYAAQAVKGQFNRACHLMVEVCLVENLEEADVVVDDIVDSGATRTRYEGLPFFALFDKQQQDGSFVRVRNLRDTFLVFPWERMTKEDGPTDNVRRILQFIGDDPNREGLLETPNRVIKSYGHLFSGYGKDIASVMKVFEDGACDEMVLLKDIEFFSTCEHHMQPFFGRAHIAYLPDKKVLGVSKLARVLEVYARRLQIQERLTAQVADALMEHLQPKGAAVVLEAKHFCMVARGVEKQNSIMTTSALRGAFKDDPTVRSEFMSMIR